MMKNENKKKPFQSLVENQRSHGSKALAKFPEEFGKIYRDNI